MGNWDKISLFQYQQIEAINSQSDIPPIDKTLFSMCILFNYTEFELDNLPLKKVDKLGLKLANIFNSPFDPKPLKRVGRYFLSYDISKMTFGQYVELSFFLSANPLQNAHYTMASISAAWLKKNNSDNHRKKSEYFLTQPVTKIVGCLNLIMKSFMDFNKEYKNLFGLDREVSGDAQTDPFNKRYGWIYSASQVAEYERITNEQAFKLPIRQALNDLAYLKAKSKYEAEQLKEKYKCQINKLL